MTQREAVWRADNGTCVACGKRWPRTTVAPTEHNRLWTWQPHHAIAAQRLRREHVPVRFIRTEALCVLLCATCHGSHTSRMRVVAFEALPVRVLVSAEMLGPWAEDALRRQHPPR